MKMPIKLLPLQTIKIIKHSFPRTIKTFNLVSIQDTTWENLKKLFCKNKEPRNQPLCYLKLTQFKNCPTTSILSALSLQSETISTIQELCIHHARLWAHPCFLKRLAVTLPFQEPEIITRISPKCTSMQQLDLVPTICHNCLIIIISPTPKMLW